MTLNLRKPPVGFHLLREDIEIVYEYIYLGVIFSNKRQTSLVTHHISAILQKAEKRENCHKTTWLQK